MAYALGATPPNGRMGQRRSPIGVGIAVCPQSRCVAVNGLPDSQSGAGAGAGDGLGSIFTDIWNTGKSIVGPAAAAAVDTFKRQVTGAALDQPIVRGAIVSAAQEQLGATVTRYAPLALGAAALFFLLRRR